MTSDSDLRFIIDLQTSTTSTPLHTHKWDPTSSLLPPWSPSAPTPWIAIIINSTQHHIILLRLNNYQNSNHMNNFSSLKFKPLLLRKRESWVRTLTTLVNSWARSASRTEMSFSHSFMLRWLLTRSSTWLPSPKSIEALLRSLLNTTRDKKLLKRFSLRSHQEKTLRTSRASQTTLHSLRLMRSKRSTERCLSTKARLSLRSQTRFEK